VVASGSNYNLVVACDMPFLSIDLLRFMVGQLGNYDVVIPRVNKGALEPLHAVFSRRCIAILELLIRQDRLSILDLFPLVNGEIRSKRRNRQYRS
jgi:molybdopterin-guanine dinucleotide biosynthesis protein A